MAYLGEDDDEESGGSEPDGGGMDVEIHDRCAQCEARVSNLMAFCTVCGFKNHAFDESLVLRYCGITIEEARERCVHSPRWHQNDISMARSFCAYCGENLKDARVREKEIDDFLAEFDWKL